MNVPMMDLSQQHTALLPELRGAFEEIVASGRFIMGPRVEALERKLAAQCQCRHVVGVSSGTDALLVALMALGIGAGHEVITVPFTFFATAGCVARVGARPVFVDIDPVTFNLDPAKIEAAVSPRTRAIIPVHLYGQTADMQAILKVARKHGLAVIEDACQAIGARDGEMPAGSMGDVGCLSFYPTKNLSALGDAGACTTNSLELDERLRSLRMHGEVAKYHHKYVGGNFRLDALQAAMLTLKLPHLDGWTEARRGHARRYTGGLAGLPLKPPVEAPGRFHVFNQYTVRVPGDQRDALRRHLAAHGIGQEVYYPVPLHLQQCFGDLGYDVGSFPEAERAAREVLSLPIFPELTPAQLDEVIRVVREFFR